MSDKRRRHTGLASCTCIRCDLVNCGAVDRGWDGWSWVWLGGEARIALFRLTQQEPPVWPGPRLRWAGCVPWFSALGMALDFDDGEGDDDGSV
jgi:hypothetical protein